MEALPLWLWHLLCPNRLRRSLIVALDCAVQGVRLIVTVECTEAKNEGGTPSRYVTQKASIYLLQSSCL
jgi:hypothetical protein